GRVPDARPEEGSRLTAMAVPDAACRLIGEQVTGRVQPPAEIHVLTAAQPGVEAADGLKGRATDDKIGGHQVRHRGSGLGCGTCGPEIQRRAYRFVTLQPGTLGGWQDTATRGGNGRVRKLRHERLQPVRLGDTVAVQESHELAAALSRAGV